MTDQDRAEPTQAEIDHRLMATFCRTLDSSALPPMTVMRMMASALGAIYRQTSASHHAEECPCGWQPLPSDVETLLVEIEAAARRPPVPDITNMQIAGRASPLSDRQPGSRMISQRAPADAAGACGGRIRSTSAADRLFRSELS